MTEDLLKHAIKFGFGRKYENKLKPELYRYEIYVEFRGLDKWTVTDGWGNCYDSKEKELVDERSPSNRTDEFLQTTRFSLDEAVEIAKKLSMLCFDYCIHLNIKEVEQNLLPDKPDHICLKYNQRVKHESFHPRLMRCQECRVND